MSEQEKPTCRFCGALLPDPLVYNDKGKVVCTYCGEENKIKRPKAAEGRSSPISSTTSSVSGSPRRPRRDKQYRPEVLAACVMVVVLTLYLGTGVFGNAPVLSVVPPGLSITQSTTTLPSSTSITAHKTTSQSTLAVECGITTVHYSSSPPESNSSYAVESINSTASTAIVNACHPILDINGTAVGYVNQTSIPATPYMTTFSLNQTAITVIGYVTPQYNETNP